MSDASAAGAAGATIRVLIADDQAIVCAGLKVVLEASPRVRVVGTAADGAEAVRQAEALRPDVVLMDLKMPVMNGVEAMRALRERCPEVAVLVLTTYDDDEWVVDAIRAGAVGYLLKDAGSAEIMAAIEGTAAGRTHVDPAVAAKLFTYVRQGPPPSRALLQRLTVRERAILRLLASGLTNQAIGERLALAEGTVRNHVSTILAKLEVADRAQATAIAWRSGLVGHDALAE
ncbi:MAG TPA: response regulator transcription factor [Ktedonobacterales bacterium]|nr:response regulator transcription factor [Ktedonobacterales bacterium]